MKNHLLISLIAPAILMFFSSFSINNTAILGEWINEKKTVSILLYMENDKLQGKVVWLLKTHDKEGNLKIDKNNPDEKLRNQPIMGLIVLKDFERSKNNLWDKGLIYDPKTGKSYKAYLSLKDENTLSVRGYVGFSVFGKTILWERNKLVVDKK